MVPVRTIPPSFPRKPDMGSEAGAQPKLLVRQVEGQYVQAYTDEELRARYAFCDDLLIQLLPYSRRKASEHPEWSSEQLLQKVAASLRSKGWGLTEAEVGWLIEQLDEALKPH